MLAAHDFYRGKALPHAISDFLRHQKNLHTFSIKIAAQLFLLRKKTNCRTKGLEKQRRHEEAYWNEVLARVVLILKILMERGLPLRGSTAKYVHLHY